MTANRTANTAATSTIGGDLYLARGDAAIADIYNGSATLNVNAGGNLTVGNGIVLGGTGTTATVVINGGTLKTTGPIAAEVGSTVTSSLTLTAGTLDLGGGSIGVSTLTLNTGTLLNAGQLGATAYTKASTGSLTIGGTNTFTNALVVNAGTLILAGPTNTSGTTLNADAVLRVTNSNAFGTGALAITAANAQTARLELGGGVNVLAGKTVNLNARGSFTPAIQSTDGDNTFAGNLVFQSGGGNYFFQSDLGAQLDLTGQISSAAGLRTITVRGAGNGSVDGNIIDSASGTLAVSKLDSGRWTISSYSNTYTGGTSVGNGTLALARLNNNGTLAVSGTALAQFTPKTFSSGSFAVSTVSALTATSTAAIDVTNNGPGLVVAAEGECRDHDEAEDAAQQLRDSLDRACERKLARLMAGDLCDSSHIWVDGVTVRYDAPLDERLIEAFAAMSATNRDPGRSSH